MMGSVRRIDSLGRIVLPKDIRQKLLIKSGDLLDVTLYEEDSIIIKKNSIFEYNKTHLITLVSLISKKLNCNTFVINSSKIIYSSKKNEIGNSILDDIGDSKNSVKNFKLSSSYVLDNNNFIRKIIINGDVYGYVIYEFKDSCSNDIEKKVDFCTEFLCSCLEI